MQIIGHRGASGYISENTMSSFQKAIAMGVDMIELDVYVIKSGEIVVFHDDTVERVTNGTGKIEDYTLNKLSKLVVGNEEKIPQLHEVLDLVQGRMPVNIELKGDRTAKPVARLLKKYINQKKWNANLFLVTSFKAFELRKFAKLEPRVRVGMLYEGSKVEYNSLDGLENAFAINLNVEKVTRSKVEKIHAKGLKVFVYTVNTKKDARQMFKMKVDGVFTNYPDKFLG